jgi:hypothetical protein
MANEIAQRDLNRITVLLGVGDDADLEIIQIRVDPTTKRLLVDSLTESIGHGGVGDGTKTVTTAGTRVQLSASSVPCRRVWIQASSANTGVIVVGAVTCVAAEAGRRGRALWPTQGDWFDVDDLNLLYLDATVNNQSANFYYET